MAYFFTLLSTEDRILARCCLENEAKVAACDSVHRPVDIGGRAFLRCIVTPCVGWMHDARVKVSVCMGSSFLLSFLPRSSAGRTSQSLRGEKSCIH